MDLSNPKGAGLRNSAARVTVPMHDGRSSAERRWLWWSRRERARAAIEAMWRTYVAGAEPFVHSPAIFLVLNLMALYSAGAFMTTWLSASGTFYTNAYGVLTSGSIAALIALCAFWQMRVVRNAGSVVMVAVFVSATLYMGFHDAQAEVAVRLQRLFPFSANELPHAADLGTTFVFAMQVADLFEAAPQAWGAILLLGFVQQLYLASNKRSFAESRGHYLFIAVSIGMVTALSIVGIGASNLEKGEGIDVLLARRAIEVDFTQNHLCEGVAKGEAVHVMSTAADIGVAVPVMPFPEKPLRLVRLKGDDMFGVLPSKSAYHRVSCLLSDEKG